MKIVDCFFFNDELEYLEFRLSELYEYVDYFMILESNVDFLGKEKKSFYQKNKNKYSAWSDKIINVFTDNKNNKNPLKIKINQSSTLIIELKKLDLDYDDIFILSDIDEIPNLKEVKGFDEILNYEPVVLLNKEFVYNKNNKSEYEHFGSLVFKYYHCLLDKKIIEKQIVAKQNKSVAQANSIKNGWHLSKFFDYDTILEKIKLSKKLKFSDNFFKKKSNVDFLIRNLMKIEKPISSSKLIYTETDDLPLKINVLPHYDHKRKNKKTIKINLNQFIEEFNEPLPSNEIYNINNLDFFFSYKVNSLKTYLSKEFLFDYDSVIIENKKSQYLTDFYKEFYWFDIKNTYIVDLIKEYII